jgi:hypothetical protein
LIESVDHFYFIFTIKAFYHALSKVTYSVCLVINVIQEQV